MFKGESSKLTEWLRKSTGFLAAAYGSAFRPVIEWVEDQDNIITYEARNRQFGSLGAEPVDDVQETSEQVHVALLALTESESFDIVLGAAPSGQEVQRRLVRSSGTTTAALDKDIKTAALEALVPCELVFHWLFQQPVGQQRTRARKWWSPLLPEIGDAGDAGEADRRSRNWVVLARLMAEATGQRT